MHHSKLQKLGGRLWVVQLLVSWSISMRYSQIETQLTRESGDFHVFEPESQVCFNLASSIDDRIYASALTIPADSARLILQMLVSLDGGLTLHGAYVSSPALSLAVPFVPSVHLPSQRR